MTVKMLFIFYIVKSAAIFILGNLEILNKELQYINQVSKIRITALVGYAQNILESATKQNHFLKYFHFIMKQVLRLVNIKENDTLSDGNLH